MLCSFTRREREKLVVMMTDISLSSALNLLEIVVCYGYEQHTLSIMKNFPFELEASIQSKVFRKTRSFILLLSYSRNFIFPSLFLSLFLLLALYLTHFLTTHPSCYKCCYWWWCVVFSAVFFHFRMSKSTVTYCSVVTTNTSLNPSHARYRTCTLTCTIDPLSCARTIIHICILVGPIGVL